MGSEFHLRTRRCGSIVMAMRDFLARLAETIRNPEIVEISLIKEGDREEIRLVLSARPSTTQPEEPFLDVWDFEDEDDDGGWN